jgi:Mrp family chromosome partitioning ATPase
MRQWVEQAAARHDLVIFDTPPVLSVADSRILAALADAVVLVVDPGISSRRAARQSRLALEAIGARVLGVILNNATFRTEDQYYAYYAHDGRSGRYPEGEEQDIPEARHT